jgi:ACS family tartrate transporter-like MFS transporter
MQDALKRVVLRKVAWRLLPFLFLLYVVNILDRVNVGFARLQMLDDLQMGERAYALGAGIFYIGYLIFEIPSNLILSRVGARRWIGRILISWGLITMATMAVRGPWSFYLLRISLGFAEAGFFPGIILYLTYWFPARERAKAVSLFMTGSPLTGIVGAPLSGGILQYLNQVGGLRGWQWLFLLEGIPAVVLGVIAMFYLTDRPERAHWLNEEERNWLSAQVRSEETYRQDRHGLTLWQVAIDRRVWILTLVYFAVAGGSNSLGFYLPKFMQLGFPELAEFRIGLLVMIPSLCAVPCMVLNGMHSDWTGERRWHVAIPALIGAAGWGLAAVVRTPALYVFAFALAQIGIMSVLPTFWSLPTAFLSGTAAAGGIALINSIGNLGGFFGPNLIGQLQAGTGGFSPGMLAVAATLVIGAVLALCVGDDDAKPAKSVDPHRV